MENIKILLPNPRKVGKKKSYKTKHINIVFQCTFTRHSMSARNKNQNISDLKLQPRFSKILQMYLMYKHTTFKNKMLVHFDNLFHFNMAWSWVQQPSSFGHLSSLSEQSRFSAQTSFILRMLFQRTIQSRNLSQKALRRLPA